jgi:hypothetical protein
MISSIMEELNSNSTEIGSTFVELAFDLTEISFAFVDKIHLCCNKLRIDATVSSNFVVLNFNSAEWRQALP